MKIIVSKKAVERHLRRRGWLEAAHALRARSDNWFVQDSNSFLMCEDGHLSWCVVSFEDDPIAIYLLKGVLAGLENVTAEMNRATAS